jgi:hypothetical protein
MRPRHRVERQHVSAAGLSRVTGFGYYSATKASLEARGVRPTSGVWSVRNFLL